MKIKKNQVIIGMISLLLVIIFTFSRLFIAVPSQYSLFEIMIFVGAFFPLMIYSVIHYRVIKIKESMFPMFIEDIGNNLEIGVSLFDTVEMLTKNNYKSLSKDITEMYKEMTWGRNFSDAFRDLCMNSGSNLIRKSGLEIISTLDSGGSLSKVLLGVATSMKEYQNVLRERKGEIYEQVITGYMVFFIFLGIIIVLITQLLPFVKTSPLGVPSATPEEYKRVLFHFSIIEALCVAFVTGQMSEGSIRAGFKHVLILLTATVIAFTLV